jgi:hypothetical protein
MDASAAIAALDDTLQSSVTVVLPAVIPAIREPTTVPVPAETFTLHGAPVPDACAIGAPDTAELGSAMRPVNKTTTAAAGARKVAIRDRNDRPARVYTLALLINNQPPVKRASRTDVPRHQTVHSDLQSGKKQLHGRENSLYENVSWLIALELERLPLAKSQRFVRFVARNPRQDALSILMSPGTVEILL